ncbi:MAG: twin-arginine translocase subunit TatC [Microbacteriaceae bacterium]|nr:twin-arginine translocase subunit TatC [Microbacteriaceae bacterium]
MSLGGHLRELRKRILIAALGVLGGTIFGWWASDLVFVGLQAPIAAVAEQSGRGAALNFDTIAGSFDLRMQIAITIGIVVSSPLWLYEIWAFLTPGLMKKERAFGIGFICSAVPLFLAGCAVGWMVMPHLVELFVSFAPADSISNISARYYYDFVLKLMIATGVGFVLPVILVLLNFAGVVSGRAIIRGWRWAILVIVTFTAATTPVTDIVSMFLLAVPMLVLYFAAAGVALLNDRRRRRREAAFLAQEGVDAPADLTDLGDAIA